MTATFTISAFGDEIASDLEEQLTTLNALGIGGLDLRGAWGKNVVRMEDDDLAKVVELCDAHGSLLPEPPLDSIRRNRVALKGPLTTPVGKGFRSVNVTLRETFDLYANVRPVVSMPGT